jgi:hypothetical protein
MAMMAMTTNNSIKVKAEFSSERRRLPKRPAVSFLILEQLCSL